MSRYIELHAHSYFSLLDGASSPEALVERATALGMPALAITDHDSLGGVIRFQEAARKMGIKPVFGAEITLRDGSHLTLLARTGIGYANLSRLVSFAHLGQAKGQAALDASLLARHNEGLICLSGCAQGPLAPWLRQHRGAQARQHAQELASWFEPGAFYIELERMLCSGSYALSLALGELAHDLGLPVVATGNVHYAEPGGARLQDVLVCIRHNVTLPEAGTLLRPNAEAYLHSAAEMGVLFGDCPEALENSVAIAEACQVALDFARVSVPAYPLPEGESSESTLRHLCEQALPQRYTDLNLRPAARDQMEHELEVIQRTDLNDYFLVVHDIMAYARQKGILCQGRGSAANSVVCYLLGITAIEPLSQKLLFERFLSVERHGMGNAMPDIDIDFERTRREEVIQYIYRRYGWEHTAMACTLVTYHTKSALRDVGKALGFAPEVLAQISKKLEVRDVRQVDATKLGGDLDIKSQSDRWQTLFELCRQLDGLPRHLSIHSGGMIVTRCPLVEVVPLEPATMEGRVVTQWDKDSLEASGLIKIDVLSLAMLAIISEAGTLIHERHGVAVDLSALPLDDPAIYDLICKVDTVGIFQVESRAQAQMIPQMQPRLFDDLVTEVALVRPGPISGGMVGTYIRRRRGQEPVHLLHPSMAKAVGDTLGVIIFQEQVLQMASAVAGFTPGEAELLRRAMGRKRSHEAMEELRQRFVRGACDQGVPQDKAHLIYDQLAAFAAFGFNRAHAASFALLSYVSGWLKLYYPLEFYVGWLNNQPAGFYSPDVLVEDARRHGIQVLPVDINRSAIHCIIEEDAIRLGLLYIHGCGEELAQTLVEARTVAFQSLDDLCRRVALGEKVLENLIMGGACDSWGVSRRQLLWRAGRAQQQPLLLDDLPGVPLPALNRQERLAYEHVITGVASSASITTLFRPALIEAQALPSYRLEEAPHGAWVRVGGVVIIRQHPPTAKGTTFISLRDEWGHINLVLRPEFYRPLREVMRAPALIAEGVVHKRNGSINIQVETLSTLAPDLTNHPELEQQHNKIVQLPVARLPQISADDGKRISNGLSWGDSA